jgi:hypothetical protein
LQLGDEGVNCRRWIDDELTLTRGGDEEAISSFEAAPVAEKGGQSQMALLGHLQLAVIVRMNESSPLVSRMPGRPAQGAHGGPTD